MTALANLWRLPGTLFDFIHGTALKGTDIHQAPPFGQLPSSDSVDTDDLPTKAPASWFLTHEASDI